MKGDMLMDITVIGNLIGTLGFPIVMCIMMYNRMEKQDEQHKEEMSKLTESLNNNTLALTKLTTRLELKGE